MQSMGFYWLGFLSGSVSEEGLLCVRIPSLDEQSEQCALFRMLFSLSRRTAILSKGNKVCRNLIDSDGNWAGVLRLNFQPTISQKDAIGIPLIELSRGSVRDQSIEEAFFDEWNHPCRRRKTANEGLYEFYNVLWIASDGYISYRKALGRVIKDTWDRIGKEWIDVTLG
jgi:hypothetical protein